MTRLRIIAINDVYELGNFPRLATLMRELAARDPVDRTLVTLAGDFLAPSLLSSLDQGRGMVALLNALGVTHVTWGNHEDDIDAPIALARAKELTAVWLSTNLPDLGLPTYDVVTVGAHKVGLLGVVVDDPTVYRRPPFGGTRMLPARATALAMTAALVRDHGCDLVVPLTHLPVAEDRLLAHEQVPPYPVMLGGHDHVEVLEDVAGTTLAKAGHDAQRAIIVDFTWSDHATTPAMHIRIEAVAGYDEAPDIRAMVDQHMAPVRAMQAATLMRIPPGVELSSIGSRNRQTSLARMLCSRLRDVMGAEVGMLNGGGVRGSRTYRERFTFADLEVELPFDNEFTVVPMTGAEIREAVQVSRTPRESGGFLQLDDGVTVTADHVVTAIGGAPLDLARTYRVALMRNLLLGMDKNTTLTRIGVDHPERVPPLGCGREIKLVLVDGFGALLAKEIGFERIDTDHDGRLSVAEIAAGFDLI